MRDAPHGRVLRAETRRDIPIRRARRTATGPATARAVSYSTVAALSVSGRHRAAGQIGLSGSASSQRRKRVQFPSYRNSFKHRVEITSQTEYAQAGRHRRISRHYLYPEGGRSPDMSRSARCADPSMSSLTSLRSNPWRPRSTWSTGGRRRRRPRPCRARSRRWPWSTTRRCKRRRLRKRERKRGLKAG